MDAGELNKYHRKKQIGANLKSHEKLIWNTWHCKTVKCKIHWRTGKLSVRLFWNMYALCYNKFISSLLVVEKQVPYSIRSSDAKNRQTVVKESASCRTIVSCNHLPVFPISNLLVTLRCSLNWSSLTLGSLLESRPSQSHSRRMVRAEASFSERFACLVGWTGWVEKNSRSSKS